MSSPSEGPHCEDDVTGVGIAADLLRRRLEAVDDVGTEIGGGDEEGLNAGDVYAWDAMSLV